MAVRKITRRWLLNSFGVILVLLVAAVVVAGVGVHTYYYNGVRLAIDSRATMVSNQLKSYAEDVTVDYQAEVRNLVENFEDKDRMELMAIDSSGQIMITSSGFEVTEHIEMPDYLMALQSDSGGVGVYDGVINGENVMAVTMMVTPVTESKLAAVRFVVSLTEVDASIFTSIAIISGVALAIVLLVLFSSSYFISSIVRPVGEIGQTARKIAQGDFHARLQKQNDDEIGELCEVINYMASELANAEQMKNDFISSVSHELRTPLTAIKGWGETLMDTQDHAMIEKGMGVILKETDRLSSMVEELLDFSRMQSGRLTLMMDKIDVIAELSEAVLMFTERARREGVAIRFDEPDESVPVLGDRDRLRQVFVNILDNALKYSHTGGSITVTAVASGGKIEIRIADTGSGISAEDLPNVKTKFYKGHTTKRGSGIGLAVADEIISMHSGTLTLESEEGKGTTVIIVLPIATNTPKNN